MSKSKNAQRLLRKPRIRKKISGTEARPRLVVFRSNQHLYAQLVDDVNGVTLAATSTQMLNKDGETLKANKDSAAKVGKDIAAKALEKKIESVSSTGMDTSITQDQSPCRWRPRSRA